MKSQIWQKGVEEEIEIKLAAVNGEIIPRNKAI